MTLRRADGLRRANANAKAQAAALGIGASQNNLGTFDNALIDDNVTVKGGLLSIASKLLSSAGSAFIGFIQNGPGAVWRSLQDRLRDAVSVKDFGAVCDGVTDDTAAVNLAVAYCLTNNKDLKVPGFCYLANPVMIDHLVDSAAADTYFTIFTTNGGGFVIDDDTAMFSTTLVNSINPNFPVSQMVRFSGLTLIANAGQSDNAFVLDQNKFLRVKFADCNFLRVRCLHAPAGKLTQTISFVGGQARRQTAPFFKSDEITFDLKVIGGLWEAGIGAFDLAFPVGCAFLGTDIEGMEEYAIKYKGGYGLTVSGSYFEENGYNITGGCSIDGTESVGSATSENVLVTGNYFAGVAAAPSRPAIRWADTVMATSMGNLCTTTLHNFTSGSRVSVIGDYARTAVANEETVQYLNSVDSPSFGGGMTQEFIAGRGGLAKFRSVQDGVLSLKGVTINENGDLGFGTDNPRSEMHAHRPDAAETRLFMSNSGIGETNGGYISGYSITGEGGYCVIGTAQGSGFVPAFRVNPNSSFVPFNDGTQDFGGSANRLNNSYFAVAPTVTSDERAKTWRGELTPPELRAAKRIIAELGIYQWNDAIAAKGESVARLHYGVRAQQAFAIMEDEGLDWRRYAWCCHDQWDEKSEPILAPVKVTRSRTAYRLPHDYDPKSRQRPLFEEVQQTYDETEMQPTGETRITQAAGDRYGIRPDQLAFWLIAAQADIQAELEARIAALETP